MHNTMVGDALLYDAFSFFHERQIIIIIIIIAHRPRITCRVDHNSFEFLYKGYTIATI